MIAGNEAYRSALVIYRLTESAYKAGIPGAKAIYDRLKERFKKHGMRNNASSDNETDDNI